MNNPDIERENQIASMEYLKKQSAAEHSLSAQDEVLTDERIMELAAPHLRIDITDMSDEWLQDCRTKFIATIRAILAAAAPSPAVAVEPEPVAFIVQIKGAPQKTLCWPDMGPKKRQSPNLEYTPLYAAPSPSLAVRDVVEWRDIVHRIRDRYPTDVFPPDGQSIDCKSASMARLICDNIVQEYDEAMRDKPNADCSGEPTNCPDNEGYGCACDPMNKAAAAMRKQ